MQASINSKSLLCIFLLFLAQALPAADLRSDTLNIQTYQLKLDIRDFDMHILYASALMGIKAKQKNVTQINLDLFKLSVDSVKVNGSRAKFNYNDSVLNIGFAKTLNTGDSATVLVYYHGKPGVQPGDFGGFYWDDQYAFNIGVSFTSNPHNYGRVWFPCFDDFNARSYYEFFVTARATDKAFCNGLLLDVKTADSAKIWHWKLKETIPSYLASVAVAAYQTLQDTVHGINGVLPIELATLPEDSAALQEKFEHLHQAFHLLEKYWGPYPWERIGYCIVPFQEGAMEHSTNIAFMQSYLYGYGRECETTMAHELSHHWFGNLVTCDSAGDMWLNEGWASYNQSLFIEGVYGADSAMQYRRNRQFTEIQFAHIADGDYYPVAGIPSAHTYGNTVYEKGADVIHTLRYLLGDSDFFNCVQGYLKQYAFNSASTTQLRDYLSQCSGKDLTDFFNQWILAPGYTHFSIGDKYIEPRDGKYEVYVNIRQRLSHAPAFYNKVPVTISYFDKNMKRKDERVLISGENNTYVTTLNFKPEMIVLDYNGDLEQALTSEAQIVRDSGAYQFNRAQLSLYTTGIKDSALIWTTLNLIPAENMVHPFPGLYLHNARYWTIDGIFNRGAKIGGAFSYGGPDNPTDAGFISNEDSLVMMYRPNVFTDWKFVEKCIVDKAGDDSDKAGFVIIEPVERGEYALGVFDSKRLVEAPNTYSREPIKKSIKAGNDFQPLYDNTNKQWTIIFSKDIFMQAELCNAEGKKISTQKIDVTENKLTFNFTPLATESYVVTLTTRNGNRIIKKLTN